MNILFNDPHALLLRSNRAFIQSAIYYVTTRISNAVYKYLYIIIRKNSQIIKVEIL